MNIRPADNLTTDFDDEDLLITDEVDLMDDFELRQIIAGVERFLGTKRGIRVSVLDPQQWEAQVAATLHNGARKQGAGRYLHVLHDPRDPHHLYVSPSAVTAINQRSKEMYNIIVFAALRRFPCELSMMLRHGLDDLVAGKLAEELAIELFEGTYPDEQELVQGLLAVLVKDFPPYDETTWALLLRKDPERFFYALRKSKFCAAWLREVKTDSSLASLLQAAPKKRIALTDMLRAAELTVDDPFAVLTLQAVRAYLDGEAA
jgi:hypothetical protein